MFRNKEQNGRKKDLVKIYGAISTKGKSARKMIFGIFMNAQSSHFRESYFIANEIHDSIKVIQERARGLVIQPDPPTERDIKVTADP